MKKNYEMLNFKKDIAIYLLEKQTSLHQLSDTKAYFVFGVLGFIAWKIIPMISILNKYIVNGDQPFFGIITVLSILTLVVSFVISFVEAFRSLFPNLIGAKDTIVYFGNAAQSGSPESVREEFKNMSEYQILDALYYDYYSNSLISSKKFKSVKNSLISVFISTASFMILYFIAENINS